MEEVIRECIKLLIMCIFIINTIVWFITQPHNPEIMRWIALITGIPTMYWVLKEQFKELRQ